MSSSPAGPSISVIVIAHDRREFLRAAVDSVLLQEGAPDRLEIVVVKNFPDKTLDDFLTAHDVLVVTGRSPSIGEKLCVGFERCAGSIIAFLEDDDLWRPGKARATSEAFARDPQGVIYHNSFERFGSRIGVPQPSPTLPDLGRETSGVVGIPLRSMSRSLARHLLMTSGLVNLSSLAVHREVLSENLDLVRSIVTSPEAILFAAASCHGGRLLLDPRPWTLYRRHAQSTTALPDGEFAEWPPSTHRRMLAASDDLLRAESYIPWRVPQRVVRMSRCSLRQQTLLVSPRSSRVRCLELLWEELSLADLAAVPGSWMANSFGLMLRYLVSPRWARRSFLQSHPDGPGAAGRPLSGESFAG